MPDTVIEPGQAPSQPADDPRIGQLQEALNRQNAFLQNLAQTSVRIPQQQAPPNFNADIFTDPEQAVSRKIRQEIAPVLEPLAQMTVHSTARLAKNAVASDPKYAQVFRKYGEEIERELTDGISPAQQGLIRANEANWEKAAKVVMANHFDDLVKSKKDARDFFLESGSGSPATPAEPSINTLDDASLSMEVSPIDRQLGRRILGGDAAQVMRFFGVDPERALKRIQAERKGVAA